MRTWCCLSALLLAAPWAAAQPQGMRNPSFEDGVPFAVDVPSETLLADGKSAAELETRWRSVAWGTPGADASVATAVERADAPAGRRVAQIWNRVNQITALAQNLPSDAYIPGQWYELTAMLRCEELVGQGCHINLEYWHQGQGCGAVDSEHLVGTLDWTRATLRFQAPAREFNCIVSVFVFGGPGKVWVDDFTLRPIDPPQVDTSQRRILDGSFWGMFTCFPMYLHRYGEEMRKAGVYWQRQGTCALAPEQQEAVQRLGMAFQMCLDGMPAPQDANDPCYPITSSPAYLEFLQGCLAQPGPAVRIWELFNEPNTNPAWTLPAYAHLLTLAGKAIKAARPDAIFASGGFTSPYIGYVEACLKRDADRVLDLILVHPYAVDEALDSQLLALAEVCNRCGRPDLAIAINETGFPTWDPATGYAPNAAFVSEKTQAAQVIKLHLQALAHKLSFVTYLGWNDFAEPRSDHCMNMGLVRVDGSPKPAYHAYEFMVRTIGQRRVADWSYDANGARTYRFSGEPAVWVVWNALRESAVEVDVGATPVFTCDLLGSKLETLPRTGKVPLLAGPEPLYLVPAQ